MSKAKTVPLSEYMRAVDNAAYSTRQAALSHAMDLARHRMEVDGAADIVNAAKAFEAYLSGKKR